MRSKNINIRCVPKNVLLTVQETCAAELQKGHFLNINAKCLLSYRYVHSNLNTGILAINDER